MERLTRRNREIFFRGKPIGSEEWAGGSLLEYPDGRCFICFDNFSTDVLDQIEVSPDTIGQGIGLRDKNGKWIFEGDILQIDTYSYHEPESGYCGVVGYGEFGYGLFNPAWKKRDSWRYLLEMQGSYMTIYEIIGNIYDDPEILKALESEAL